MTARRFAYWLSAPYRRHFEQLWDHGRQLIELEVAQLFAPEPADTAS